MLSLDTPTLTQFFQLGGAALGFFLLIAGALWRIGKGIRSDIRSTVTELIKPIAEAQESHASRLEMHMLHLQRHDAAIGFIRERTAGLESAVFKRPPITEEEQ
jgi:hypothetical protein